MKELMEALHNYNQKHCTAWALLFCTPHVNEVFIVEEDNNGISPAWWPNNATGESIDKALEMVLSNV